MSWRPTTTVTLDGVELSHQELLAGVRLERGRDGVDQQPRAGYATVTLLDLESTRARVGLDSRLAITVDGVQLFYGDVSDVVVKLVQHGELGRVTAHTLTATGVLARFARRPRPAALVQQLDGDRVATLLDDLELRWASATGTWAEQDATETWATAGDVTLDVDQPGTYLLSAISTPGDPWSTLQQAANDGLGVLTELGDGTVRYTAARGRTARAAADGFLELPPAAVLAPGLQIGAHLAELANQVRVKYAGDAEALAFDQELIDAWGGTLEHTVDTQLVNSADAQARAERLLQLRKLAAASLEAATLALEVETITAAERAELLALEPGTPVRLASLPTALGGTFTGVVERVRWTVTRTQAQLELALSDWSLSEFGVRWELLGPTDTWTTIDPTTAWNTAQELVT